MLTTEEGTFAELEAETRAHLAAYRYEVFVETLGWNLPCEKGFEQDEFDRDDTVYIVGKSATGKINGCARLLPTTQRYLLADLFPHLLGNTAAPKTFEVWELSRFSTQPVCADVPLSREEQRRRFCLLFAAVVHSATARGAARLITFTAMGVERILRSIGMHVHRLGPPQLVEGQPVLVLWIELDRQTLCALGLSALSESCQVH